MSDKSSFVCVSVDDEGVKVNTFPTSNNNILTLQEANGKHEILQSTSQEQGGLCGGDISSRFKKYLVMTTPKILHEQIDKIKKQTEMEKKRIFVEILQNLHKWTDDELNSHYEQKNKDWYFWCDDVVLYFAYNAVIFNKGIPFVEMTAEQIKKTNKENKKIKVCEICQTPSKKCCPICRKAFYCCAEHQLQDWKLHKKSCKTKQ